jgi:hypothetical protein
MFQTPALLLSLILASIYAGIFYLIFGRRPRDLFFFLLAAVVGFASGGIVGAVWGFIPWTIGEVHIIEATVVAFLFLILARWLRLDRKKT